MSQSGAGAAIPSRLPVRGSLAFLALSAIALGAAPAFLPDGYFWVRHTISESAAQALTKAWIARAGFVCFGIGVLWLAWKRRSAWPIAAVYMHAVFGLCMFGAALWSHRPWLEGVPVDEHEDLLHSVAATAMGFAFTIGVASLMFVRLRARTAGWKWDVVVITTSVVLPLSMNAVPNMAGLPQRVMFAIAYAWFAREALSVEK